MRVTMVGKPTPDTYLYWYIIDSKNNDINYAPDPFKYKGIV